VRNASGSCKAIRLAHVSRAPLSQMLPRGLFGWTRRGIWPNFDALLTRSRPAGFGGMHKQGRGAGLGFGMACPGRILAGATAFRAGIPDPTGDDVHSLQGGACLTRRGSLHAAFDALSAIATSTPRRRRCSAVLPSSCAVTGFA
jgi:hypothetical protein